MLDLFSKKGEKNACLASGGIRELLPASPGVELVSSDNGNKLSQGPNHTLLLLGNQGLQRNNKIFICQQGRKKLKCVNFNLRKGKWWLTPMHPALIWVLSASDITLFQFLGLVNLLRRRTAAYWRIWKKVLPVFEIVTEIAPVIWVD